MADVQEDDLPQVASLDSTDFIRIVENLATTPVSSVVSRAIFKTYLDTLYEPIGGGGTGWTTVTETWTRTGNHTFTVVGNLTSKYQKSTKVIYKDGGTFEFGVVYSAVFSSPNTTVTLITNTDYAMAAATITDTGISYQESPQGFPSGFNYAAAPTGFSVVPASAVYKWAPLGSGVLLITYDEPNTGTSNATTFAASAPTVATADCIVALGTTVDNGVTKVTPGRAVLLATTSTITFRFDSANAAWTGSGGKRAVVTMAYMY